jgi:hypothetical protein
MYRQVFTPTEHNNIIPVTIPREWYGQEVEIIAFPLIATPIEKKKKISEDDFMKLAGAWESDESAEDMVAGLRAARHFRKKDLSF